MIRFKTQATTLFFLSFGPFLLAILSYLLIRIAGNSLPASEYSLFAAFWSILMGIGVGLGYPLESYAQNLHFEDSKDAQSSLNSLWTYLLFLVPSFFILSPFLFSRIFERNFAIVVALFASLISFGFIYIGRGIYLALHELKKYSGLMSLETLFRLLLSLLLFNYFLNSEEAFIYAIAFSAVIVAIYTIWYFLVKFSEVKFNFPARNKDFIHLVFASLIAFSILNLGPATIKFLDPNNNYSGNELNALTLARSVIVAGPILQALVVRTKKQNINYFKLITSITILLIIIFSSVVTIFGVQILKIIFDPKSDYRQSNLLVLSVASSLYLLTSVIQARLMTEKKFAVINRGWLAGILVSLAMLGALQTDDVVFKTEVAMLGGVLTATLFMMISLKRN